MIQNKKSFSVKSTHELKSGELVKRNDVYDSRLLSARSLDAFSFKFSVLFGLEKFKKNSRKSFEEK